MTVDLAHLHVDWTLDAQPESEPRHRLDALVGDLRDQALEDALAAVDDPGLTCIRVVEVAPVIVRWTASDRDLVSTWATAIGRAVADARDSATAESMVHYPSRVAILLDVVISLLAGDPARRWAWDLAGVGPGAASTSAATRHRVRVAGSGGRQGTTSSRSPEPTAQDVVDAAFALAEEAPHAVPALVVDVARRRLLGAMVDALGGGALAALATRAVGWLSSPAVTGADDTDLPVGAPAATVAAALARLVRERSEVLAAAVSAGLLPGQAPSGTRESPAPPSRLVSESPAPGTGRAPEGRDAGDAAWPGFSSGDDVARVAATLAALAVVEVEPAYAGQPVGRAAAALLRRGGAPPTLTASPPPFRSAESDDATADPPGTRESGGHGAGGDPLESRTVDHGVGHVDPDPPPPPKTLAESVASSAWGGLLFLLWLVAETDLPARVVAEPERFGTGLRRVLHRLGAELMRRAAPEVPPDPRDPALLAFCGLAPGADPPEPPEASPGARVEDSADGWLEDEAGRLVALLSSRLEDPHSAPRTEQRLMLATLRRRSRVRVEQGWVDVELDLDEVSTELRRAGLDLDPGHLPWLGLVVRFRYV